MLNKVFIVKSFLKTLYSKGTPLGLQFLRYLGTRALEALWHSRHLGTGTLEEYLGTWAHLYICLVREASRLSLKSSVSLQIFFNLLLLSVT